LAIVGLAALGSVFLFCCGVPLALLKRPGRFQRFQETNVPRQPGLLDQQDDMFEYLDDFQRRNEEEMNQFRRHNNEFLKQMERDREERIREFHRQLDEF
jgi:DNA anti-recombination protein RmuC